MAKRQRDPAAIELPPIDQDARFAKVLGEIRALEERHAAADRRKKVAQARLRGEEPTRSFAERAAALLKGGQVAAVPAEAEYAAANEELEILWRTLTAKRGELEQVRAELSLAACSLFAPSLEDSYRGVLEALGALHNNLEVGRVIAGRIVGAGYLVTEWSLPIPRPMPLGNGNWSTARSSDLNIFALPGDPEGHSHTAAGRFKDWLRDRGILR
jgi:hypothetical protein